MFVFSRPLAMVIRAPVPQSMPYRFQSQPDFASNYDPVNIARGTGVEMHNVS